jgi:hypothetical protein
VARDPDVTRRVRARNEVRFREVNQKIHEVSTGVRNAELLIILCECGDEDCLHQIELSAKEYEAVRGHGTRFVLHPGHERGRDERVVARKPGFLIVEKLAEAADVAEQHDPRG